MNLVDYRKVKKKSCNLGHSHGSAGEVQMCLHIQAREQSGECKLEQSQDHVYLTAARILYIPDFKIFDFKLNETVWEEFKGFETDIFLIKKRLWKAGYGPGRLRIYKMNRRGIYLDEEILPKIIL